MMPTAAGQLRERVRIEQATEAQNAYGEATRTWAEFDTVWAAVRPVTGNERMEAHTVKGQISHRVRVRYLPGIVPKMRISYRGRLLHIDQVYDVDERRRMLDLMCREEV